MLCLRNSITGEIVLGNQTFDSAEKFLHGKFDYYIKAPPLHNYHEMKCFIKQIKEENEVLELCRQDSNVPVINAWEYVLKDRMISSLLGIQYGTITNNHYKKYIKRFGDGFSDRFIVELTNRVDINQLGLVYVNAKLFDPSASESTIIVTQDQLNFIKLFYDEQALHHVTDVNAVLSFLKGFDLC